MTTTRRSLLSLALAAALPPAFVRHATAGDVDRFPLGVASGWPRPDGIALWTRLVGADLPDAVEVQWELARDEGFADVVLRGRSVARAASAHSVHVDVDGLAPARWYWYRFGALGVRSPAGRTRTAPAPDATATLEFAIASCQRWDHGHWAAWRHLADDDALDLVLFLGDYIYEYATPPTANRVRRHAGGPAHTLEEYRERHAQYKSDPLLQRIHARVPWIATWDDHEVGNDYAGLQSETLAPDFAAQRSAAYQAYWEHMPLPASVRPAPDGSLRIASRCDWGRLARIHVLDTRQQRDVQACSRAGRGGSNTVHVKDCPALAEPRRTLLGRAQERWLADGWAADGRWNLVAQQTLFAPFTWRDPASADTPGGMVWTDGWSGYPAARQRLLDDLVARRATNVVVLGGDVHANYVADLHARADDAASPVVATEFCGTSISSHGMPQYRLAAALPFNQHIRHARADERGCVRFSLDARTLHAQLQAVDDPLDAASGMHTQARFVVEAGRAGAQPQRA